MESKEHTDTSKQDNGMTFFCPHCNKDFKVEDIKEVECSDCGMSTISILTKRCGNPDCDNIYCKDCLSNLNDYGFCTDCEILSCDGCDDDVDRGTHISCPKCEKTNFCSTCAPEMVDSELGCIECLSSESTVECCDSNCYKTLLKEKAISCKNFSNCKTAFCKEHAEENLDEQGYCEDCSSFDCSYCENSFHIEEGIKCSNTKCKYDATFCKKCSEFSLDTAKRCPNCSTEPTAVCVVCETHTFIEKTKKCGNCSGNLCLTCNDEMIECTKCHKKMCGHCGKRCKVCQKPFCNYCNNFDNSGQCREHKKKNIFVRIWDYFF